MTDSKSKTDEKKQSIKRKIDLDLVNNFLDPDLKQDLLIDYTTILNQQEQRNRDKKIVLAKQIFDIKNNLLKNIGKNDQEREEMLRLVSSFPTDQPETDKGWSRVLGLMERGGKSKSKRVVEFPETPKKKKASPKKKSVSKSTKTTTKK